MDWELLIAIATTVEVLVYKVFAIVVVVHFVFKFW